MRRFILSLIIVLSSSSLLAQKSIEKAMDALRDSKLTKVTGVHIYKDDQAGPTTYKILYDLLMDQDQKTKELINNLEDAFMKESKDTYYFYIRHSDGTPHEQVNVLYGPNNEFSHIWGERVEANYAYAFFKDPADITRRYAYCLSWREENGKRRAFIAQFYGKRPVRDYETKKEKSNITIRGNSDHEILLDNLNGNSPAITFMRSFGILNLSIKDAMKEHNDNLLLGLSAKMMALCSQCPKEMTQEYRANCSSALKKLRENMERNRVDEYTITLIKQSEICIYK